MVLDYEEASKITKRLVPLPESVSNLADEIINLSNFIHSNPELGSEEFLSVKYFLNHLKKLNVNIEENYLGMETSFRASFGKGKPKIAILAEYDALPIGHACGHNIIGAWAYGVFTSLIGEAKKGSIYLIGTPAEEGRGKFASSKVRIAPELVKEGFDAVFTVHPGGEWEVGGHLLGTVRYSFVFKGKNAHAAASPEKGINALDAAVSFYTNFRLLHGMLGRHHHVVLSAIIKDGGTAPNIIPGRAEVWADARSEDEKFLSEIEEKIIRIANTAAEMHNCGLEYSQLIPRLSPRKPDQYLDKIYYNNGVKYLGDNLKPPDIAYRSMPRASSDVGNISQLIPTVHLGIKIGPLGLPGHSEEMKYFASAEESKQALLTSVAIGHDSILDYIENY